MARKFLSIQESYKNSFESSKQDKKDLLDKVKNMQVKNKGKSSEITFNNTPTREKNESEEKLKKEVKKLESRLEDVKEELATSNKSNRELVGEQKKLKSEIFELKQKIKDLELTIVHMGDVKLELENQKKRIIELELLLEKEGEKQKKLREDLKNSDKGRQTIKQNCDKATENLKTERKTNGVLADKNFKLNNTLKHLAHKLSESEKETRALKDQLGITNVDVNISYLLENFEHIDGKQFKQLSNIYESLKEKFEARKLKSAISLTPPIPKVQEDIRMGYISNEDLKWFFYDLSGNTFKLYGMDLDIESNTPAKVRIEGDFAVVINTYKYNRITRSTGITRKKKIEGEKTKINFMQLEPINVLIVGSRNIVNYVNRLRLHGIEAMCHNPFEESEKRLSSKYKWADLVLVCEQHISHGVWDIVDKKDVKVQSLKKDNANIVVSRILFHQKQKITT